MKIDLSKLNAGIHLQKESAANQMQFDVVIRTENIELSKDASAPDASIMICTPGCQHTGTGKSYCCNSQRCTCK